jgi:hypothetical protein
MRFQPAKHDVQMTDTGAIQTKFLTTKLFILFRILKMLMKTRVGTASRSTHLGRRSPHRGEDEAASRGISARPG